MVKNFDASMYYDKCDKARDDCHGVCFKSNDFYTCAEKCQKDYLSCDSKRSCSSALEDCRVACWNAGANVNQYDCGTTCYNKYLNCEKGVNYYSEALF